jgi:hypothetical protein
MFSTIMCVCRFETDLKKVGILEYKTKDVKVLRTSKHRAWLRNKYLCPVYEITTRVFLIHYCHVLVVIDERSISQ